VDEFNDSCELAKVGLAVWVANREAVSCVRLMDVLFCTRTSTNEYPSVCTMVHAANVWRITLA
jgi:hypothetical protein